MNGSGSENMFVMLNVFAVAFIILYFIAIRPRRKKERELEQQKKNLKTGDIVTTIGGIVGIVVNVKDEVITMETGSDRNKIRVKTWAIRSIEKLDEEVDRVNSNSVGDKKNGVEKSGSSKVENSAAIKN